MSPENKKLLIIAQKNWIKFRDSHCKFVGNDYEDGSMQSLIHFTCLTEQTRDRIDELQLILEKEK